MTSPPPAPSNRVIKRRKVSKACVNCRRRKIKCTGIQPCSNCQAYKCPCEFVEKNKPSQSVTSNDNTLSYGQDERLASLPRTSVSSLLSTDNEKDVLFQHTVSQPSQLTTLYNMNPPETPIDNNNDALRSPLVTRPSQITNHIGPSNAGGLANILSTPNSGNDDTSLIARKKRKYTKHPKPLDINEPQFKDNGLYTNDLEDQPEYKSLVQAINQLETIPKPNDIMKQIIKETREKLDKFIRDWKPVIDFDKLNNFKDTKSIETKLMKNKYRNIIYLSRFASLNTTENCIPKTKSEKKLTDETNNTENCMVSCQQSFLLQLPLVDELFGLYSPVDALSLRGVGALVQKYATVKDKDAQAKMKATVYILLRFFDMCCLHLNEGVVSIANPLENYIERKNGTSCKSAGNRSNKDLVTMIINKFPQPFTQEITSISNGDLLKLVNQDLDMFRTLLKMYDLHRIGFEKMAMNLTHKNYHPTPDVIRAKVEPLVNFCELQDLLLTLCYSYYNATLYHLDEYNSLDYLELLLLFLDHQLWVDQDYGYEKVLVVALDCALKSGLNRWEYYVNIDETLAERRRVAWWRLYEHEKMFALRRGYISGINDDKVNCLLPEPMRRVGFVDHKDFINRILTFEYDSEIFQEMSIKDLKFYGQCALVQIISDLYMKVMFNGKYTSITNVALPQSIREEYLNEIYEHCEVTKRRMERVKEQTSRLFEIAGKPRPTDNAVPGDDVFESSAYTMLYTLYCVLNLKSCTSLSSRLMNEPKTDTTKVKLLQFHKEIHEIFSQNTKFLLTLETSYEMWRVFELYCFSFLTSCFNTSDKYQFITIDNVIDALKLFNRVLVLSERFDNFFLVNDSICQSQTIKEFGRSFSMVTILLRILLLHYMVKYNLNVNQLEDTLERKLKDMNDSIEIVSLIKILLDHNSYAFNFVLSPVQESGFHLNVQQIMETTYGHNSKQMSYGNRNIHDMNINGVNDVTISVSASANENNKGKTVLSPSEVTAAPGVYPAFVLHDAKGNKVKIRNSSSSLPSLNHGRCQDGHSPTLSSPSSLPSTNNPLIASNIARSQESDVLSPSSSTYPGNPTTLRNTNTNTGTDTNYSGPTGQINVALPLSQQRRDAYVSGNNHTNNNGSTPLPLMGVQSPLKNNLMTQDHYQSLSGPAPLNNTNTNNNNNTAYNFGTLEEFVNNTDLNDLYRSLWNDNLVDML